MSERNKQAAGRPHGVLWEGRSLLDDGPIVAVVTSGSSNRKTGPMAQVWILRQDVAPHEARKQGEAYHAGLYQSVQPADFARSAIRWGAYGDPAFLPGELVRACNAYSRGWTGYTHQHAHAWAAWSKGIFMASIESPKQEARLSGQGWGTFRVGRADGSDVGAAAPCPYDQAGTTCIECRACDGRPRAIYVAAHGAQANAVPAERLRKRKG